MNVLKQFWLELLLSGGIFASLLAMAYASIKRGKKIYGREDSPIAVRGKVWRIFRYVLRLGGFAVIALTLATLGIMLFRVFYSLKHDFSPVPSQVESPTNLPFQIEEVGFTSEDGVQIAGWSVPSKNGVTIILLHGYGGNRTGMLWHAEQLVAAGYGVLLYDERASGESGGGHRSYGWEDPRDVKGALIYLKAKKESEQNRIGIAGCSMGGQIALQGAAYYPEIGAVWADAPAIIRAQDFPRQRDALVQLILAGNYLMDWVSAIELGMAPPKALIEIITEIPPRPIMLVGSGLTRPLLESEGHLMKYYANYTDGGAQVWVIPDAGHCHGPDVRPDEYASRMIAFFDSAFGITR